MVHLKAKFLNVADIFLDFNFNITASKGDFTCVGKLAKINKLDAPYSLTPGATILVHPKKYFGQKFQS